MFVLFHLMVNGFTEWLMVTFITQNADSGASGI